MAADGPEHRPVHFGRRTPDYRHQFDAITADLHARCQVAWSDTYDVEDGLVPAGNPVPAVEVRIHV